MKRNKPPDRIAYLTLESICLSGERGITRREIMNVRGWDYVFHYSSLYRITKRFIRIEMVFADGVRKVGSSHVDSIILKATKAGLNDLNQINEMWKKAQ